MASIRESLLKPHLSLKSRQGISYFTDETLFDAAGVRIAFTSREGGVSLPPFDSLNLSASVGDSASCVLRNRELLLSALAVGEVPIVVPKQVHGNRIIEVKSGLQDDLSLACSAEADGVAVRVRGVGAMVCVADCVPVIIVAPGGDFIVIHSGWRGCMASIGGKGLRLLTGISEGSSPCSPPDMCNIYIGPYIHAECFETSREIAEEFKGRFGSGVERGLRHIDLGFALRKSLIEAGADRSRIVDCDICTVCESDRYFSYRAENKKTGRLAAFAVRP